MEKEIDHNIPFLGVLINNDTHFLVTNYSVYHKKKTFTALLTNYFDFASHTHKLGLTLTLVGRAYKINNTWLGFHGDITKLTKLVQKNLSPVYQVENIINRNLAFTRHDCNSPAFVTDATRTSYFKLPYISPVFYYHAENMFSVKDAVPRGLPEALVYKFLCAGCSACYVGKTTRHISIRVREHIFSDRTSHIFKH